LISVIAGPRTQANSITFDIRRLEPGLRTRARAHSHRGRIPLGPPLQGTLTEEDARISSVQH
jgi:hypothetical protein